MLEGKGFFIWQIRFCENGDPAAIARLAKKAGFTHVVVKIADAAMAYNVDMETGRDLLPPLVASLREMDIKIWGWHYVYGRMPIEEAEIAIRRVRDFELDGYVIDVESPYKYVRKHEAAGIFMEQVRSGLRDIPIALSSYRYPTFHPQIPWQTFLEKCDINMPQFYWAGAHNPRQQLQRCLAEFQAMEPFRPIIPTGAAFVEHGWEPYVGDIQEVFAAVKETELSAINFWEWMNCRKNLPQVWDYINDYDWGNGFIGIDITKKYIDLLNNNDIDQVVELYAEDAYMVTDEETLHNREAIRKWYDSFIQDIHLRVGFTRISYDCTGDSCSMEWQANRFDGDVITGKDIFRLKENKIIYHYKSFSI